MLKAQAEHENSRKQTWKRRNLIQIVPKFQDLTNKETSSYLLKPPFINSNHTHLDFLHLLSSEGSKDHSVTFPPSLFTVPISILVQFSWPNSRFQVHGLVCWM